MFKKILIPTDGSKLSAQAANKGVCFARTIGAEVVALHVTQPFAATVGFDGTAAAYAITAIVLAGLVGWVLLDQRARRRDLAELEAAGVRRRSERSGKAS